MRIRDELSGSHNIRVLPLDSLGCSTYLLPSLVRSLSFSYPPTNSRTHALRRTMSSTAAFFAAPYAASTDPSLLDVVVHQHGVALGAGGCRTRWWSGGCGTRSVSPR
jgi:hypothetical protein